MTTLSGLGGVMLLLVSYYLLWVDPQTELEDVIIRTRTAILTSTSGSILSVYYLFKKNR